MSHLSSLRELHSAASYDENDGGGDAEAAKDGSGVSVAVTAGPTTVQLQGPSSVGNSWSEGAQDDGFLKRAGRRLRLSMYGREQRESYYRDSIIGPDPAVGVTSKTSRHTGARARRSVPALRRRVLPQRWQEAMCGFFDSLSWNLFILALTIFAVFAPDIVIITSAPDYVNPWVNSFLIAAMAIFGVETLLSFLCRPVVHWLRLVLDIVSNLSLLFAITWFTDAVGARTDGTTSDAARACRIVRLVRIVSVLEILGRRAKERYFINNPEAAAAAADQLAPSNIGKQIGEIATLQVAAVVIATVVCTTLLIGADVDTGSTQGLQAFVDSLAANAAAGADAAQLQPTIDAMLAFSADELENKQKPMVLEVQGVGSWSWVEQQGGWTARSSDRAVVEQAAVSLQVNVAKGNHFRAGLNMALAGAVIVLLLAFVVHLNLTIWKMLVQPLDRIFYSIRTNAAQVVAALGPPAEDDGGQGQGPPGSRSSKKDDLDIITIEAAVTKMGRILEQYTSTGGVGLNAVKKMATNADQSTKEWLATMVAGPGSEEVVTGRRSSDPNLTAAGIRRSRAPRISPVPPNSSIALRMAYGRQGGAAARRSRLGRLSEIQVFVKGQPPLSSALAPPPQEQEKSARQRRSSLAQFQQRSSSAEATSAQQTQHQHQQQQGSPLGPGLQAVLESQPSLQQAQQAQQAEQQHATAPASPPVGTLHPLHRGSSAAASACPLPGQQQVPLLAATSSASSDAAALATAVQRAHAVPAAPSEAWAQLGSSSLSEADKKLLTNVDVDYLHSFGFDALGIPPTLLPAYACAMFLELDLAFFSGDDAEPNEEPSGRAGFVDVPTLWRFVNEVSSVYQRVPYHNFQHCVDVTHTTFMFIKRVAHKVALSELEQFALMVAAISHDLDHPGVNNAFLVNARDPLATTYNDSSVLENRHVACLYTMLLSKPQLNIFARLDPAQWREVRKMVIGAVLSTDMVHHFAMVSKLEVFYELHAASIQAHHRALRQGRSRDSLPRLFDSGEERQLLLNLLLHCADISNPVKPVAIAEKWAERVLAEFFAQGDRERSAGLAISPMCDREKTSRAASQINFIEFVVAPIYVQVYKIFPELGEVLDNLIANRHFWQDALLCELAAGGDAVPRTPEQRAEEEAKAEKRLRDFQEKYREILSKRKLQLARLASTQSNRQSFFAVAMQQQDAPLSPPPARHGSLMAMLEEAAAASSGWDSCSPHDGGDGSLHKSQSGGAATGLIGKLFSLGRPSDNNRGSRRELALDGSLASDAGSRRGSEVSSVGELLTNSFTSAAAGCLGGGSRVAPEDDAV